MKKPPLTRAAGASKIRVNPFHPRHSRCHSCRFRIKHAKHHYREVQNGSCRVYKNLASAKSTNPCIFEKQWLQ